MDPFRKARGQRRDTADSLEITRIVNLPIVGSSDPEVVEAFSEQEVQARFFEEGFRLNPCQVDAVLAYDLYGGGLFPVGVGWGKTLISLMVANRAFERGESERSIVYVPSQVFSQLTQKDIAWARRRVGLSVPFHLMGDRPPKDRRRIAGSGKVGCYLMTYSLLSTKDADTLLSGDHESPPPDAVAIDGILPDLIILDEAHNVKNRGSARTTRLLRYLQAHQPALVAMSGTITSKSIQDYHHLIAHALREYCPLPLSESLAHNWSYVLDPEKVGNAERGQDKKVGPLKPLITWAKKNFPDEKIPPGVAGFRKAYQLRLTSAPGVVSTGDAQIGVSLTLCNRPVPKFKEQPGWDRLEELFTQVEELWLTPSGDEIEHGFHKHKYRNELTSGFYYKLRWPEIEELTRRGLSNDEAHYYLERAKEHHAARQALSRSMRKWIDYRGRSGMDTPLLVTSNMAHHGARDVGQDLYDLWREVKDLEFEGMPQRISEPVRICDYKIRHATKWAEAHLRKNKRGALVWFHHDETGRWAAEYMKEQGLPAFWCPAESVRKGMDEAIRSDKNKNNIMVVSMGGHGTGKNLQTLYQDSFFLDFPRQAPLLEQVLGRTHRVGQLADELYPVTCNTTDFDHENLWACLIDSLYIHQTTANRQKAIYASYDPLPKRYPMDFLRERGFTDVSRLDALAQAALDAKFGE